MSSDSEDDDDDLLLQQSAFSSSRASTRAKAKEIKQQVSIIDSALKASTRGLENLVRCNQIKMEYQEATKSSAAAAGATAAAVVKTEDRETAIPATATAGEEQEEDKKDKRTKPDKEAKNTKRKIIKSDDDDFAALQARATSIAQAPRVHKQETLEIMTMGFDANKLYKDSSVFPRQVLIERVRGLEADGTASLGVRKVICFDAEAMQQQSSRKKIKADHQMNMGVSAVMTFEFFKSKDDCEKELVRILAFDSENAENKNPTNLDGSDSLTEGNLQAILHPLRKALEFDMLSEFLDMGGISLRMHSLFNARSWDGSDKTNPNNLNEDCKIITDLIRWLYSTAVSAKQFHLSTTAMKELRAMTRKPFGIETDMSWIFGDLPLELFDRSLQSWVDIEDSNEQRSKRSTEKASKVKKIEIHDDLNSIGLLNLLFFWASIMPNCKLCPASAKNIVVALSRIGVDVRFEMSCKLKVGSVKDRINDIHVALFELLRKTLSESEMDEWCKDTAQAVFLNLKHVGPGEKGSDDADDSQALLVHGRVVDVFLGVSKSQWNLSLNWTKFQLLASLRALHCVLLAGSPDEDKAEFLASLVDKTLQRTSHYDILKDKSKASATWLAAVASFAALQKLFDEKSFHPLRSLAVVDCAFLTFQASMYAFMEVDDAAPEKKVAEYKTVEDAQAMAAVLELLTSATAGLSKCIHRLDHAHFRKADYLLTIFHQYSEKYFVTASAQAGHRTAKPVQKDVRDYFVNSP